MERTELKRHERQTITRHGNKPARPRSKNGGPMNHVVRHMPRRHIPRMITPTTEPRMMQMTHITMLQFVNQSAWNT